MATNNKRFVRVSNINQIFDATNLAKFLVKDNTWEFLETARNQGVTKDSVIFIYQTSNAEDGFRPDIFYENARLIIAQGILYDTNTIDKQLLKGWDSSLEIVDASISSEDDVLTAFGKLQGQIDGLKEGISNASVIMATDDAPYATTTKRENGVIVIDLSVGTLADASNGKTGLAKIEDIYQVLTEDELVWAAALNALNVSINIVNASVIDHERRIINLEASVYDISLWIDNTKEWINNTDTSIANIKTDIIDISASLADVSSRVKILEDASYVNTVGAKGDEWVKASFDASKGNVTLTVGMADNVMVDSNNITGAMTDSSILTAKAVQDMINNKVTAAVDFLGVFGNIYNEQTGTTEPATYIEEVLLDVSNKTDAVDWGDFFKLAVDVSSTTYTNIRYHAGDMFVFNQHLADPNYTKEWIVDVNNWEIIHGEPDSNTWRVIKVNGDEVLSSDATTSGSPLDLSAGENIDLSTNINEPGKVVIGVVNTSTAPWHDAQWDWVLL